EINRARGWRVPWGDGACTEREAVDGITASSITCAIVCHAARGSVQLVCALLQGWIRGTSIGLDRVALDALGAIIGTPPGLVHPVIPALVGAMPQVPDALLFDKGEQVEEGIAVGGCEIIGGRVPRVSRGYPRFGAWAVQSQGRREKLVG